MWWIFLILIPWYSRLNMYFMSLISLLHTQVNSADKILELLNVGNSRRKTESTEVNETSSRWVISSLSFYDKIVAFFPEIGWTNWPTHNLLKKKRKLNCVGVTFLYLLCKWYSGVIFCGPVQFSYTSRISFVYVVHLFNL